MPRCDDVIFFFDCDNTLLDHDRIQKDLRTHLVREFGRKSGNHYWDIFERLRAELGYADYLGALQRYRRVADGHTDLLLMSSYLFDYEFRKCLYPGALRAIAHANRLGKAAILTDGDVVFQPRKIERSGLWQKVDGRVAIFEHKAQEFDTVKSLYPSRHYVIIDNRRKILRAAKTALGAKVTTVAVMQGSLARAKNNLALRYKPDISIDTIAAFNGLALDDFLSAA